MDFYGVDPDLHILSVAVLDQYLTNPRLLIMKVPKAEKRLRCVEYALSNFLKVDGPRESSGDTCMVEGQKFLPNAGVRIQDLLELAAMTGAMGGWMSSHGHDVKFVLPQRWKGSVPKRIHHGRLCMKLGWETVSSTNGVHPVNVPGLVVLNEKGEHRRDPNIGEWADCMDSFGLAMFCRDYCLRDIKPRLS